jgi:hypothetical protein
LTLHRLALLIISGVMLTACGDKVPEDARAILKYADQFELLSLNPSRLPGSAEGSFHGYNILGSTAINDADTLKRLVYAFEKGVSENHGFIAACFNPRHGIRVTSGGRTAEFVICFECAQVQVYVAGGVERTFLISGSPQALFNEVLRDAHVPLPSD